MISFVIVLDMGKSRLLWLKGDDPTGSKSETGQLRLTFRSAVTTLASLPKRRPSPALLAGFLLVFRFAAEVSENKKKSAQANLCSFIRARGAFNILRCTRMALFKSANFVREWCKFSKKNSISRRPHAIFHQSDEC